MLERAAMSSERRINLPATGPASATRKPMRTTTTSTSIMEKPLEARTLFLRWIRISSGHAGRDLDLPKQIPSQGFVLLVSDFRAGVRVDRNVQQKRRFLQGQTGVGGSRIPKNCHFW